MAKFSMKDYENYMKEEEKQVRLQERLEIEVSESDRNWQDDFQEWQRKQEEEKRLEEMMRNSNWDYDWNDDYYCDSDDDYDWDDDYYCDSDDDYDWDDDYYCDSDDDYDWDDDYYCDSDDDYDWDDDYYCDSDDDIDSCYLYPRCDICSCYPCQYFLEMQSLDEDINDVELERIERKSVSRNRHLTNIKAKKRAQKSAEILKNRYQRSHPKTGYEEYRLYTRQAAAVKKAARVKAS